MTNTAIPEVAVPASAVPALSEALNSLLADSYALYLKTKNFHWHVSGPNFAPLHLLFDEQAAQILAATDDLAERARKLGGRTLTSIGDIARRQSIKDNDAENVSAGAMVAELAADNKAFAASLRRVHELCAASNDFASASLIENYLDEAEKRAWFLSMTAKA
jgi:starvation-inducible DNA-binding protein